MARTFDFNKAVTGEEDYDTLNAWVQEMMEIDNDLDYAATEQMRIFSFLQRVYSKHARRLEKEIENFDKVKHHRKRRYLGKWTAEQYQNEPMPEIPLKSEVDEWLKVDDIVIEQKKIMQEQERCVTLIEEAQKAWNARGHNIKTALQYKQFIAGSH